jgi:hypothetical protein
VPYLIALFTSLLVFAHRGIVAVAICMTACQAAGASASIAIAGRMLAVPYGRIGRALLAPFLAALGMGAVVAPIAQLVTSPWPALLAGGAAGTAAYAGLVWLLAPDIPQRVLGGLASRRSGRPPVEPGAVTPGPL